MSQTLVEQSSPQHAAIAQAKDIHFKNELIVCSNCGVALNGQFCHQCGQSSRSMIKFFGEVIRELLDDIVGYDSRLKHSLIPLLFRPGKLTLEYIKGRRFHYVMPFRLYLFTSLLFILVLQLNTDASKMIPTAPVKEEIIENIEQAVNNVDQSELSKAEIEQAKKLLLNEKGILLGENNEIDTTAKEKITNNKLVENGLVGNDLVDDEKDVGITWKNGELTYQGPQIEEEGVFKDVMDEINDKAQSLLKDPKRLFDELFQLLPYMMFILLPIYAIFFKVFYLFSKRFYVEHLIFSLHNHSFLYTTILIEFLLDYIQTTLQSNTDWLSQSIIFCCDWASSILLCWIVIYIVMALKRVYEQNWWLTIAKSLIFGFVYITLLSSGLLVTFMLGAYIA